MSSSDSPLQIPPHWAAPLFLALILLTLASPALAWAAGVLRRDGVRGRCRVGPHEPVGGFFLCLAAGLAAWLLGAQMAALRWIDRPQPTRLLMANAAGTVACTLAILLLQAFRKHGLRQLGLDGHRLLRGLGSGLVGLLIVLPWLFWVTLGLTLLLQRLGVENPSPEHEIFTLWPKSDRQFRLLALLTAVVIAPVAEELVFRGVIQTLSLRLLMPLSRRKTAVAEPVASTGSPVLTYAPAAHPAVSAGAHWGAILIASLLFAGMHRPWPAMVPIFLLSLALGYLYERTGNLWSVITMHMLFNLTQFSLFLALQGG